MVIYNPNMCKKDFCGKHMHTFTPPYYDMCPTLSFAWLLVFTATLAEHGPVFTVGDDLDVRVRRNRVKLLARAQ